MRRKWPKLHAQKNGRLMAKHDSGPFLEEQKIVSDQVSVPVSHEVEKRNCILLVAIGAFGQRICVLKIASVYIDGILRRNLSKTVNAGRVPQIAAKKLYKFFRFLF